MGRWVGVGVGKRGETTGRQGKRGGQDLVTEKSRWEGGVKEGAWPRGWGWKVVSREERVQACVCVCVCVCVSGCGDGRESGGSGGRCEDTHSHTHAQEKLEAAAEDIGAAAAAEDEIGLGQVGVARCLYVLGSGR